MSDQECAERIRFQYLGQPQLSNGLDAGLIGRIATDIATQCGVTRLRAHRLARGWTVDQAVDEFHRMCRRENIKARGLTSRSWQEWEAGSRPSWDYQDLVSQLFRSSPVALGWASDYSPAEPAARGSLTVSSAAARGGSAMILSADMRDGMRHSLMHLPPDISDFTGRAEQVDQVSRMISTVAAIAQAAPPIVCLSGQGGVGKTTLAIHVAHQIDAGFPDGQLYASLRRADAGAHDPADVLSGFLRELGVDGADVPEGLNERARMYRAQLAGHRVLVVLDDATDEAQVRPLLPGSAGCAVLVTSRSRLAGLAGAHDISLRALPPDQAIELLAAIIDADRAKAEPEAMAEVARLCSHLPLALRIAGARLVSRPALTISWLASRLRDESRRLDLLRVGDLEVRASFTLSYDGLTAAGQLAFRALGLLGTDFPAWNLAAVLETDADEAERLLEQLADAALVDIVGVDASGLIRYRLHGLLRDFAIERLHEAEDPGSLQDRLVRLADEYIGAAELALALVHPGAGDSAALSGQLLLTGDVVRGDPWGWLAAERTSLVELVEKVHAAGLLEETWRLAEALPALFDWRADWRSWEQTHQLALNAARHATDITAEARILRGLGVLYRELGRYGEAATLLTQAAGMFGDYDDRHQWAAAMRDLGDTYRYQGCLAKAICAFSDALTVFQEEGDTRSVAGALSGLADSYRGLSQWDEATSAFLDSIGLYQDLGDRLGEGRAKVRYALVFRDQHLSEQALPLIAEGLDVARQFGDRRWEARAMRQLAIVARGDGDTSTAIGTLTECLAIFRELEDRCGQAVTLRNRGDSHRLAGSIDSAARDLAAALTAFQDIGDRRGEARSRVSIAGLCRLQREWAAARGHLDAALATFRDAGDQPGEARALREAGLLLRDQDDHPAAGQAMDASQTIFTSLGDDLWTARVLATRATLKGLSRNDPALARHAAGLCRQRGITEERIPSVLREW